MGVPAFYRWLADKYAKCVVDCLEDDVEDPSQIDTSQPNPNGMEVCRTLMHTQKIKSRGKAQL